MKQDCWEQPDFATGKSLLETVVPEAGHDVIPYPKKYWFETIFEAILIPLLDRRKRWMMSFQ